MAEASPPGMESLTTEGYSNKSGALVAHDAATEPTVVPSDSKRKLVATCRAEADVRVFGPGHNRLLINCRSNTN